MVFLFSFAQSSLAMDPRTWSTLSLTEKGEALLQMPKEEQEIYWPQISLINRAHVATQMALKFLMRASKKRRIHHSYPHDYRQLFHQTAEFLYRLAENEALSYKIYRTGVSRKCPTHIDNSGKRIPSSSASVNSTLQEGKVISAEVRICSHTEDFSLYELTMVLIHELAHASGVDRDRLLEEHDDSINTPREKIECGATLFTYLAIDAADIPRRMTRRSYAELCPSVNSSFNHLYRRRGSSNNDLSDFQTGPVGY